MKIIAISDIHGMLPDIPECDVVLIAGDICVDGSAKYQLNWLDVHFRNWLRKLPAKHIIGCAGNHDWVFYEKLNQVQELKLPWVYLQDEWVYIQESDKKGIKIYGTPHQKIFYNWAFNLSEDELEQKWNQIPDDVDVIVCHSPPFGYGDRNAEGENCGSPSLLTRIKEIKPELVVFGHIHEGRGIYNLDKTVLANVTMVNRRYQMVYEPIAFDC